jgi:hypothetical protein
MKLELTKLDYQYIELLFNTMRQLSKVNRDLFSNTEYKDLTVFYNHVMGIIEVYDSARFSEDDFESDDMISISKNKYKEFLDYEMIYKSIDSIRLKDEQTESYRMYYKLVVSLLERYDYLEYQKQLKKERSEEFLKDTSDKEFQKIINAYEETLSNYRKFKDEVFLKFKDNDVFMDIVSFYLENDDKD